MQGTFTADKIITVFAFEWMDVDCSDAFGSRKIDGYIQVLCLSGVWYDILTNDEARHMYE